MTTNATHAYVGRAACGCIYAAMVDVPGGEKRTAVNVAEMIECGLTVQRVTIEEARIGWGKCPHKEADPQLALDLLP